MVLAPAKVNGHDVVHAKTKQVLKKTSIGYILDLIEKTGCVYIEPDEVERKKPRISFNGKEKAYLLLHPLREKLVEQLKRYPGQETWVKAISEGELTCRMIYQCGEMQKYGVMFGGNVPMYVSQDLYNRFEHLPVTFKNM